MALRSFTAVLGLVVIAASSSAVLPSNVPAQMVGYPNGGGRIPGTVATGPQFPIGGINAPQSVSYNAPAGSGPIYIAPSTKAYNPAPGTDPLTGPAAVYYGTPQPVPQSAMQPAPQAVQPSMPIATPVVSAPVQNGPMFVAPTVPTPTPTQTPLPTVVSAAPAGPTSSYGGSSYSGNNNYPPNGYAPTATPPTAYGGNYNAPSTYTPPTPDFSTPPAIPRYTPNATPAPADMPPGQLKQSEISPYAKGSSPPSFTSWLPRSWQPQSAPAYDNTPANSNYGAAYGDSGSTMGDPSASSGPFYPGQNCAPGVPCACAPTEPWYTNVGLISTLDAFKTPVDLDGLNANFGKRIGGIASFPIFRDWGLGAQVSSTAAWYDWKGSQFTGHDMRFQNYNSVGVFQRSCTTGLGFGIAHDWLYDDYYVGMHISQFRVATSWEINCNNEIGFWGALPQRRDSASIGTPPVNTEFQSLLQGNLYWKHYWSDYAWTSTYAGLAESPGDISYGANVQVAVNSVIAVTGACTYVVPGSGGSEGRQEEIWNLSFGFIFYPGTAFAAQRSQFRPMFAPADPGNFATLRK